MLNRKGRLEVLEQEIKWNELKRKERKRRIFGAFKESCF